MKKCHSLMADAFLNDNTVTASKKRGNACFKMDEK
jgi:hypothetical protein